MAGRTLPNGRRSSGKDGGPRHADAVALGEAERNVAFDRADAANGTLKEIYHPEVDRRK